MISVKNIAKSFGSSQVLRDISFNVQSGEKIALLGPGSSGKSTIIKVILGLMPPDSGNIELFGEDFLAMKGSQQQQLLRRVGMAFQQGGLFDFMSVYDNLAFATNHMTDFSSDKSREQISKVLAGVKLPGADNKFPYELSGGMQKRVGIARALAIEPDIAIFDEPTAGLDPVTSTIILNMIFDLGASKSDRTLMVVTSNVEVAIRFADRIVMINDGVVVADGPWRDLILNGDEWVQHYLSVRLIGLDEEYAQGLHLPKAFIDRHWITRSF
ncbi:MAG: ATP-binding cassette domain-containing protein [Oligoflexales bacterium]|nr:ATP-binding cassette domain-containing protein [Oligoflexales bacterium]